MIRVMLVGPAPDAVGGIAAVVGEILSLTPADGVRVEHMPITLATRHESIPARMLRHVGQLRRLAHRLRHQDIDLVHLHTCSGASFFRSIADLLVARSALGGRRRVILHVHGGRFVEFHDRLGPIARWMVRSALEYADAVVVLSDRWADRIGARAPRARIDVIENACPRPPAAFRLPPSAFRWSWATNPHRPAGDSPACRFLMISKLDVEKGVIELLDAAVLLRSKAPFTLHVAGPAGSAGDARSLRRCVAARGLDGVVEVSGAVVGAEKAGLLASSDVLVLPSHAEGMPICVLEAMQAGLAVVTTDVGALPEMIESGRDGLLIEAGDVTALAAAMRRLAEDPPLRWALGTRARHKAATRFGWARMRARLLGLYERLAGEPLGMTAPAGRQSGSCCASAEGGTGGTGGAVGAVGAVAAVARSGPQCCGEPANR